MMLPDLQGKEAVGHPAVHYLMCCSAGDRLVETAGSRCAPNQCHCIWGLGRILHCDVAAFRDSEGNSCPPRMVQAPLAHDKEKDKTRLTSQLYFYFNSFFTAT